MKSIERIACYQDRRDDQPNIVLAESFCRTKDKKGIREIVAGLKQEEPLIAGDCIKVLYEIGARSPELVADFVPDFIALLASPHNRLVWGAMTALSLVAALRPHEVYGHIETVLKAFRTGSVITVDRGVTVLAAISAASSRYEKKLWPLVVRHLETCRPKELPQHAERAAAGVNSGNVGTFTAVLNRRLAQVSANQRQRIEKLLSRFEKAKAAGAKRKNRSDDSGA